MNRLHRLGLPLAIALGLGACTRSLRVSGSLDYGTITDVGVAQMSHDAERALAGTIECRLPARPAAAADWETVLSFVHASDIQLRDSAIRFFSSRSLEEAARHFSAGTLRDEDLDRNDEAPYLALVGAVNALDARHDADRPSFFIHTGDSIDAGSLGELEQFMSIANRLTVPWFNVMGNHDVFLMGNFTESNINIDDIRTSGLPLVLNRAKFMRAHGFNVRKASYNWQHAPTEAAGGLTPSSRYHGFDCDSTARNCTSPLRSYYSMSLPTSPRLRVIVLDTTNQHRDVPFFNDREVPAYGAEGYIEAEQFEWLRTELELARTADERVLVFGHHPLVAAPGWFQRLPNLRGTDPEGERDVPIVDFLRAQSHVLAYFGGHTHTARIDLHEDSTRGGMPMAEVIAGSVHEFPQSALLVNVLKKGDELAVLVRPIAGVARGGALGSRQATACRGAHLGPGKKPKIELSKPCGIDDQDVQRNRFIKVGYLDSQTPLKVGLVPGRLRTRVTMGAGKLNLGQLLDALGQLRGVHFTFSPETEAYKTRQVTLEAQANAEIEDTLDQAIRQLDGNLVFRYDESTRSLTLVKANR